VIAVVCAVLLATPSFELNGLARTETPEAGVLGCDCSVSDHYRDSTFKKAYYIGLALVFGLTLVGFLLKMFLVVFVGGGGGGGGCGGGCGGVFVVVVVVGGGGGLKCIKCIRLLCSIESIELYCNVMLRQSNVI
jgi:hypothetical protein